MRRYWTKGKSVERRFCGNDGAGRDGGLFETVLSATSFV